MPFSPTVEWSGAFLENRLCGKNVFFVWRFFSTENMVVLFDTRRSHRFSLRFVVRSDIFRFVIFFENPRFGQEGRRSF